MVKANTMQVQNEMAKCSHQRDAGLTQTRQRCQIRCGHQEWDFRLGETYHTEQGKPNTTHHLLAFIRLRGVIIVFKLLIHLLERRFNSAVVNL